MRVFFMISGDHLIGYPGFEAPLPQRSQMGTTQCDLGPCPPSTHPRRYSTLEGGAKGSMSNVENTTIRKCLTLRQRGKPEMKRRQELCRQENKR